VRRYSPGLYKTRTYIFFASRSTDTFARARIDTHLLARICTRTRMPSISTADRTDNRSEREREREGGKLVSPSPSLRRPSSPVPGTDPSIRKFAVLSRGRICSCAMREESAGSSISLLHSRGRGDDILPCHVTRGIICETARIVRA